MNVAIAVSWWVLALVVVDFVSGLVHWAEDTFFDVSTPIVGPWIVAPNVLHHRDAAAFVKRGWFASNWDLTLAGVLIVLVAWAFHALSGPVVLLAVVGAHANQIHKWCHAPASAPMLVKLLWKSGLLQRPAHHGGHHSGEKNTCYCVVTPFVNPVLDRLGFWRGLERVLVPLFGAPRREDLVKYRWYRP